MLAITGVIITLAGIVFGWSKRDDWNSTWYFLISLCVVLCGITMCGWFAFPVDREDYTVFQQQKAYMESHVVDTEVEDAALTAKKTELNDWLFRNQYRVGKHPSWYINIPEGFLEEMPIE